MRHLRFDENSAVTLVKSIWWIKSRNMMLPGVLNGSDEGRKFFVLLTFRKDARVLRSGKIV